MAPDFAQGLSIGRQKDVDLKLQHLLLSEAIGLVDTEPRVQAPADGTECASCFVQCRASHTRGAACEDCSLC